jgi:hypothetical protein
MEPPPAVEAAPTIIDTGKKGAKSKPAQDPS